MKYNDYTAKYTYESFKKLTVSEKSALLSQAVIEHGFCPASFTTLAHRSPILAMQDIYNGEKKMGFPLASESDFNFWLDNEATSLTQNERWYLTPEGIKSLDALEAHYFAEGFEAHKNV
jgi:hypothetical protein